MNLIIKDEIILSVQLQWICFFSKGMRGKRDVNEIYGTDEVEEIKRAPAGFFGMRGKKQPNVRFLIFTM